MKKRIAEMIVRRRAVILAGMLLLAVACGLSIGKTRINYDLTRYLDDNTMTKRALAVMEEEFGAAEQLRVMFWDVHDDALQERVQALSALPQVRLASFDPEKDQKTVDGTAYRLVTLTLGEGDITALVRKIRAMYPGESAVAGQSAALLDVQKSVGDEIPGVMAIAVAVVLLVLLLTSHAWLEPLVILLALAVSIVINMGTNFIFPDVSFITFAVSAILQLALSIDYAIMLLHAYNRSRDGGMTPENAMAEALAQSMMPVSSSAFTTVAGLLSLLFMSFTIGFDIGLVLSKGILISLLTVFLLMPAVTLLFEGPLRRTRHKPLQLGGDKLAGLVYRLRVPLAIALIAAVAAGFILQNGNTYLFTDSGQSLQGGETQAVERVFGASNPMALLVPGGDTDADYDRQRLLCDRLMAIEIGGEGAIQDISAMVTTGTEALKYYTPQDVSRLTGMNTLAVALFYSAQGFGESVRADKLISSVGGLMAQNETVAELKAMLSTAQQAFNGPHYARLLLNLRLSPGDSGMRGAIDEIQRAARDVYGENYYLTGIPMSTYDIGSAFEGDLMKVNLITFLAILLIVALSFRGFRLPLLLVFVIEGAIWITMAVSRVMNQPIFFMSYLICVSIQMGATIDYGILLSSHYRAARSALSVPEALSQALRLALPTVLTSGVILITAGYIIGKLCSIYYIYAIGLLLSRGALISVVLVLTLLPALLCLFDRAVMGKSGRNDKGRSFTRKEVKA